MRVTYDPKANVAYIRLREKAGDVQTIKVTEEVWVDIAPDGAVFGIELLNANEQLFESDHGRLISVDSESGEEKTLKVA